MSKLVPTYLLLLILYTLTFLVSYKLRLVNSFFRSNQYLLSTSTTSALPARSIESTRDTAADTVGLFGGLRLNSDVAGSMRNMRILQPTDIQRASLVPISKNTSCIIHASTGTGKTLCYLLPLLNRIYAIDSKQRMPFYAIIILPTRELAIQVASDVSSLTNGDDSLVHLCLSSSHAGFKDITAPIIIGTSYKLLDTLRATDPKVALGLLKQTKYLVLDEVDRLVGVLGKYATYENKKFANEFSNPTVDLIGILAKIKHRQMVRSIKGSTGADGFNSILDSQLQVVASSATIGRPLRRELYRLFHNPDAIGTSDGSGSIDNKDKPTKQVTGQFGVIRATVNGLTDNGDGDTATMSRVVGIPSTIRHIAVLDSKESDNLSGKLALLKDKWMHHREMKRAILFVPTSDDVLQVVNMLKFWGLADEVVDLQAFLSAQRHDNDGVDKMQTHGDDDGREESVGGGGSSSKQQPRSRSTSELLASARQASIGSISRQVSTPSSSSSPLSKGSGRVLPKTSSKAVITPAAMSLEDLLDDTIYNNRAKATTTDSTDRGTEPSSKAINASVQKTVVGASSSPSSSADRRLYVISLAGSRGLHLQDVECVMLPAPPRTMDEYLHAAGRTGRVGNTVTAGVVYTVATLDELKRLQSWQTPLGIGYEVIYS